MTEKKVTIVPRPGGKYYINAGDKGSTSILVTCVSVDEEDEVWTLKTDYGSIHTIGIKQVQGMHSEPKLKRKWVWK